MNQDLKLRELLIEKWGPGGSIVEGFAPGRVNLIGEHTDYNDGFVLPMALEFRMVMAGRKREDPWVNIFSIDYGQAVSFTLDAPLELDPANPWSNYLRGVCQVLQEDGYPLTGMDLVFGGDIPHGAGLSSSAALEVLTALMAQELSGLQLDRKKTVLLCQKAENEFVGMKCGVMDQFASMMGREGHALFLDCRSLEYQNVPLEVGDHRIVICHSGVKHELVASEYNKRWESCQEGVAILKRQFPSIRALRDVTIAMLEQSRAAMSAEIYRRCKHVIAENQRVLDSVAVLRQGKLAEFGALMDQSHDSLRDEYEVSCPEVDLLVELARKVPGVLGARITGGGFGGCTVNLVAAAAVERFEAEVLQPYQESTGIEPRLFVGKPAAGAQVG